MLMHMAFIHYFCILVYLSIALLIGISLSPRYFIIFFNIASKATLDSNVHDEFCTGAQVIVTLN